MARKRVYIAGIGSPEWQARTGHIVNERGDPIAVATGHDPVADYRGDHSSRARHKTGTIPYCRTCRQTLIEAVLRRPCPGKEVKA